MVNIRRLLEHAHTWFVASHRNEYHPHLLAERGMMALFALILGAEAFLVAHTVSLQPGTPSLAAVGAANTETSPLPPVISSVTEVWMQHATLPLVALAAHQSTGRIALFTLTCIAALLMAVLAYTLAARRRAFQTVGYITGGVLLLFTITLQLYNMDVLFPQAQQQYQAAALLMAYTQRTDELIDRVKLQHNNSASTTPILGTGHLLCTGSGIQCEQ
jgi:hypothetical protein